MSRHAFRFSCVLPVEDDDLSAVDEAIAAAFDQAYPARTLAGVAWVSDGARLQVEALAARY